MSQADAGRAMAASDALAANGPAANAGAVKGPEPNHHRFKTLEIVREVNSDAVGCDGPRLIPTDGISQPIQRAPNAKRPPVQNVGVHHRRRQVHLRWPSSRSCACCTHDPSERFPAVPHSSAAAALRAPAPRVSRSSPVSVNGSDRISERHSPNGVSVTAPTSRRQQAAPPP